MLKKFVALVLLVLLAQISLPASANLQGSAQAVLSAPSVSAQSYALLDAEDGVVLSHKNGDVRMAMASTTKIMTALVAIENCEPSKEIKIPPDAVGVEGSSVYLFEGEVLTLSDLLYAMLLASANDAATAIAISVGGSVDGFSALMNKKADELGLHDTHFTNPHGLYDEEHYTTAAELGRITAQAMKNELLSKIFATKKATIIPIKGNVRTLKNHNKLLWSYEGSIGVKTGFTKKSGRCLVSAAKRDELSLICVTLSAPDDWRDHASLLDWGFDSYRRQTFFNAGDFNHKLAIAGGKDEYATLINKYPLSARLMNTESAQVSCRVLLPHRFEFAPIDEGDTFGSVACYVDGKCVSVSPLIFTTDVERAHQKISLWERIKNFFF